MKAMFNWDKVKLAYALGRIYVPTGTEVALDDAARYGQYDESGGTEGEEDRRDSAVHEVEPPIDPVAYVQELEDMGE